MPRRERTYSQRVRARILLVGIGFALFLTGLLARAVYLQVVRHRMYADLAEEIQTFRQPLAYQRGDIYDRRGEKLAGSLDAHSVFVDPQEATDKARVTEALASELHLPREYVAARVAGTGRYARVQRLAPEDAVRRLRAMKLPGVGFQADSRRHYPQGELAAHVLGFVGDDCVGLEGLEKQYDEILRGRNGYLVGEQDAHRRSFFPDGLRYQGLQRGCSLVLTLDATIQFYAEQALDEAMATTQARRGIVIAMEPKTGRVLAMASRPGFDPRQAARYPQEVRHNLAVSFVFEPGSTFKSLLLGAVLESGIAEPDGAPIYCEHGLWHYGGAPIHDSSPHDWMTLREIIQKSSNIGAGKLGLQLGPERLYQYMRRLGLGQKTGIGLPGEERGLLVEPRKWSKVAVVTHAFGQTSALTPIQLLVAFNAMVNGGLLMRPFVVEQILGPDGRVVERREPKIVRRVLPAAVAEQAAQVLTDVTRPGGTGTRAAIPFFEVAGKTGTAEKPDPATRGYHPTARIASFLGAVPARDPIVSILVVLDEPQGQRQDRHGGRAAAPVFRRIAIQTLNYLGVFPDRPQTGPILRNALYTEPAAPGAAVPLTDEETPGEDAGIARVPDLRGLPMRAALRLAQEQGLDLAVEGSFGRVVSQDPPPGTPLDGVKRVRVVFAPPA